MTAVAAVAIARPVPVIDDTEKSSTAGSALTDVTELAVRASGPSTSAVTTATPAAWCRNAALKRSASTVT